MLARTSPRLAFFLIFLFCAGLIVAGLILQHVAGLHPCPMCIMQRYAFIACGLIALIAALHHPGSGGRRFYGTLLVITALTGIGIAIRQSWLQRFPSEEVMCGPDLAYMVNSFPLGQALPMIFNGDGDCSKIDWTFLGLSLANWAILFFALVVVAGLWQTLRNYPRRTFG
ncbi:disulfide bond formation protein B [Uliginosibacterium sp. H1]|uniref:disulfide bond formation protein B n=1 Tax=Uliginosibacterium sp. H1 TaxID=3114757 RepID=UPI002E17B1F0|nr:disulfide bond formation protein B [Uliginosibacterium sp. H1]